LRINNVRILSLSFDGLISFFAGAPYTKELLMLAERPEQLVGSLQPGNYEIAQDWGIFSKLGGTILAQPVFWPGGINLQSAADIYFNTQMLNRMKNAVRISKAEHFKRFYQMQLICNASGSYRYNPDKNARVRFRKADRNDDASFMRNLYSIFLQHVLPLNPTKVVTESGERHGTIFLSLLYVEKVESRSFMLLTMMRPSALH
jgi:hypothetical protein